MELTEEQSHQFLQHLAEHAGEYAGIPYPLQGEELRVHPSYRVAKMFEEAELERHKKAVAERDPAEPVFDIVNCWQSRRTGRRVYVVQERSDKPRTAFTLPSDRVWQYQLRTLGLVCAWKLDAELKAQQKLMELVTGHAFRCYLTTGSFLETSKRSRVTYMFRRCRPTVALRERNPGDVQPLCTLCLHPIGYYDKSYGGSLVPTDDVIAHLLLMRGDEHAFWKLANQHPANAPQSDL